LINLQTGEILSDPTYSGLGGVQTPRIHSKLTDLPSKGQDMIDFATELGINLMEWQRFVCIHGHKVREDGRWAHSELGLIMARQQGKIYFDDAPDPDRHVCVG
jgi:hypothetical protein